jgi:hypothetical protein
VGYLSAFGRTGFVVELARGFGIEQEIELPEIPIPCL